MIRPGSVAIGPTSVNADDFHDRVSLRSIAPFLSAKEVGLGNNALISYTASADATATYACINGGGNHPSYQKGDGERSGKCLGHILIGGRQEKVSQYEGRNHRDALPGS